MPSTLEFVNGSTDFNAGASYTGGSLPVGGDSLEFNAGSSVVDGSLAALTAVDLLNISFRPGFAGDIGSASGSPWEVSCDQSAAGKFLYNASGRWVYLKGGSAASGKLNQIVWDPIKGARLVLMGGEVPGLEVYAGVAVVEEATVLGTLDVDKTGQVLIRKHASDTVGNMVINAGMVTCERLIGGSVYVGPGATLVYDVQGTPGDTTTGVIHNFGRVVHRSGKLTIVGHAGYYDRSQLRKPYAVVITDYPSLTEVQGSVLPIFTRTPKGVGSQKV